MRASLLHEGNWQIVLAKRQKETVALGIKDQAAGTLFMIFGQVDLRRIFARCDITLLVEV
jgi:hypothetical protein